MRVFNGSQHNSSHTTTAATPLQDSSNTRRIDQQQQQSSSLRASCTWRLPTSRSAEGLSMEDAVPTVVNLMNPQVWREGDNRQIIHAALEA
jgi:hypothetical protein